MKKAIFFIDGFNLYHSIDIPKYYKYKWLDLKKLSSLLIRANEKIVDVYFFTALTKWNKDKQARHKILIKALESTGIKTIYGKFKKQEVRCPCCNRVFQKHVEKKTDVNIATLLIQSAFLNRFDKAYLLSGDSDLVPAVLSVKQIFPKKKNRCHIPD